MVTTRHLASFQCSGTMLCTNIHCLTDPHCLTCSKQCHSHLRMRILSMPEPRRPGTSYGQTGSDTSTSLARDPYVSALQEITGAETGHSVDGGFRDTGADEIHSGNMTARKSRGWSKRGARYPQSQSCPFRGGGQMTGTTDTLGAAAANSQVRGFRSSKRCNFPLACISCLYKVY